MRFCALTPHDEAPAADSLTLPAWRLRLYSERLMCASGVDDDDARTVAHDLVHADRLGLHSHGVNRLGEYLEAIATGQIDVHGSASVMSRTASTAVVDGGNGFGQCVARFTLDVADEMARKSGSAVVVARNCHHIGRVAILAELGAQRGLLVLAFVAVAMPGPVAPLGGAQGRLGTNPISYGAPTSAGDVVADFGTAAMPEGAVNQARRMGSTVPEGILIDAEGHATVHPDALYTNPRGAILPFGGAWAHRGYALNLMVELFAGSLAGYGPVDEQRPSNSLFLLAVDPEAFLPRGSYARLAGETVAFVKSSRPVGDDAVVVPGEPEAAALRESGDHVTIPMVTAWSLDSIAGRLGLDQRLA